MWRARTPGSERLNPKAEAVESLSNGSIGKTNEAKGALRQTQNTFTMGATRAFAGPFVSACDA